MPARIWWLRSIGAAALVLGLALPALGKGLEELPIGQEPSKADWRYFLKAREADREKLWRYHLAAGRTLASWSWGWRLGWVRACGESKAKFCRTVLEQALVDKALVVRAEAATRLGRLHEGTEDAKVVGMLADEYRDARNFRRGAPLFVTERILFALHQVGGEQAHKAGDRLAASHKTSKAYWAKLKAASSPR